MAKTCCFIEFPIGKERNARFNMLNRKCCTIFARAMKMTVVYKYEYSSIIKKGKVIDENCHIGSFNCLQKIVDIKCTWWRQRHAFCEDWFQGDAIPMQL